MNRADRTYRYDPAVQAIPFEERTVPGMLARTVRRVPDKLFITHEERALTFREFDHEVNRYANFLGSLEMGAGKLAIMLPTCLEFVLGWFACAKLNTVYVPINIEYRGEILRHQLGKAEVTHMLIDGAFVERLAEVVDRLPMLRSVIVAGDAEVANQSALERLRSRLEVVRSGDYGTFPDKDPGISVRHADPHCIAFTSGTTGPSKGVLSSHCHVVSFSLDWIKVNHYGEDDVTFCPMPLFHALGSWLGVLPAVICGARIALQTRFSASAYWDDVKRHEASIALGIFSVVPLLLKQPPAPEDREHGARIFYIGQRNEEFEQRFGVTIVNAYGATETGAVTYTPFGSDAPAGSCGRPHTEKYEVRIVDEFDREVEVGEVGEVVVRARNPYTLMDGYYNDPQATVEVFRNQWFHTGDNARRDEAGWYYFVDRKKDAIRVRGENISSFEVESVVNLHPAVLESAAIAIPSPLGEDEVKLFVVRKPGESLSHDELWEYCADHMPAFWLPSAIEFIEAMPHTPTHKIMKYRLRENKEGGDLRTFDPRTRLARQTA
ncbi:MAG: ATP-dependent acyl-CoA ligase [Limnobacter sp.]|nr:ATP-dependent acyl-CoA ligase [Limnobacter sp.]